MYFTTERAKPKMKLLSHGWKIHVFKELKGSQGGCSQVSRKAGSGVRGFWRGRVVSYSDLNESGGRDHIRNLPGEEM